MEYYDSCGNVRSIDGGTEEWLTVLGMPWEEYVDGIVKLYAHEKAKNSNADRNDILRPWFNTLARPDNGSIVVEGVKKFYSDPDGLYCRMLAYEMGKDHVIEQRLHGGHSLLKQQEYEFAIDRTARRFKRLENPLYAMDHGAGMCNTAVTLLKMGFHATAYDYYTPHKRMVAKSVGAFGKHFGIHPERLRFVDASVNAVDECGKMHLIISQDVMEHLIDPVDEINRIAHTLIPGGFLLMGTFFNSCNGHDPQHLREHEHYQDTTSWFKVVEEAGLRQVFSDANGVPKVWERI